MKVNIYIFFSFNYIFKCLNFFILLNLISVFLSIDVINIIKENDNFWKIIIRL